MPDDHGLMIVDRFNGTILRQATARPVNPSRRKPLTVHGLPAQPRSAWVFCLTRRSAVGVLADKIFPHIPTHTVFQAKEVGIEASRP